MLPSFKNEFLLRKDIIFLNHGSFGACSRAVFGEYQEQQRTLEGQPVQFLGRELMERLRKARVVLASYINADENDLVYIPNATFGVNIVARSLKLDAGDEILTTNHEYGACDKLWRFVCEKTGAKYIRREISLPVQSREETTENIWSGVTPRTKVIFLSHITSPTALRLPVEEICKRARAAGIITIIDGAHAPGQVGLDMNELDADFYTGNCHKWLCAPKGSGFLWAKKERQSLLEPLVVSWGWGEEFSPIKIGSTFLDYFQWTGTADPAAFLTVPKAIQYQRKFEWRYVVDACHELAVATKQRLEHVCKTAPLYPDSTDFFVQLFAVQLPECDVDRVKKRLLDEYSIEVVVHRWNSLPLIRVSVQAYNSQEEMDALVSALEKILAEESTP